MIRLDNCSKQHGHQILFIDASMGTSGLEMTAPAADVLGSAVITQAFNAAWSKEKPPRLSRPRRSYSMIEGAREGTRHIARPWYKKRRPTKCPLFVHASRR